MKNILHVLKVGPRRFKQITKKLMFRIMSQTSKLYMIRRASVILILAGSPTIKACTNKRTLLEEKIVAHGPTEPATFKSSF